MLQEKDRLDDVTGYANCGMLLLDNQTRITYANNIAEKWFGPFHQIEGKFCWEIYKINESEKNCAALEVLRTGETAHRDISMHLENGDQKVFYVVASPVKDNIGKIIQINEIVIDITERKKAEDALRRSEKELKESQRVAQVGSWQWIVASDSIIWSPGFYRIIGRDLTLPPPAYKEHLKIYTQESAARLEGVVAEAMTNGTPYELNLELLHPDGSQRFMIARGEAVRDAAGQVVMLRGTLQDITQRSRAEEALKKSETSLKKAQEQGKIGSWEFDLKTQKINWSDQVYVLYERDKKLGPPSVEEEAQYYLPEVVKKLHELARMATETGREYRSDLTARLPSGRIAFFNTSIVPVKDETGNVIQLWGTIQDITERKKAEEVHFENLRLEAADKAKSEFLANMSHELRTPLNACIGFSDLLVLGMAGELSEKQKHYVDNILASSQFLLTLINDILDLSKIEAGKIELVTEKISVPITIKETLYLITEKAMKHNVLLETDFDPEFEFIEADKQRFKQVLFNLLSNAVKFSKEEGGTVTITAKKEGDMAKISVSDTGIGIKEENVGKLFNKFEQLESGISQKYGGTGLGLAITKQLVELHRGRIWAESRYGEGSTFMFTLPIEAKKMGDTK